jgi:hypothetical protein
MNVYVIQASGMYGGGVAIVAAMEEYRAKELATLVRQRGSWNVRYDKPEKVTLLPVKYSGAEMVLYNFETGE